MSFTYSTDLLDDISRVRFWLRDTVVNSGPLPGDANFDDLELTELISLEGDWRRAVAAGFEALASAWLRHPTFNSGDLSINRSDIAKGYQTQATDWRKRYGTTAGASVTVGTFTRVDGYSDDDTEYA